MLPTKPNFWKSAGSLPAMNPTWRFPTGPTEPSSKLTPTPGTPQAPQPPVTNNNDSLAGAANMEAGAGASMNMLENSTVAPEAVRRLLPTLRSRITSYTESNSGVRPTLGTTEGRGWGDLLTSKLVPMPVMNFWVGGPNADLVVVGTTPDKAFHRDYGWIYNPETGQLWAAGFDGNDQPLPRPNQTTLVNPDQPGHATVPTNENK
jgi:hypothetical protein